MIKIWEIARPSMEAVITVSPLCLHDSQAPATIILISGDRDFANALQRLSQRG